MKRLTGFEAAVVTLALRTLVRYLRDVPPGEVERTVIVESDDGRIMETVSANHLDRLADAFEAGKVTFR